MKTLKPGSSVFVYPHGLRMDTQESKGINDRVFMESTRLSTVSVYMVCTHDAQLSSLQKKRDSATWL